MSAWLLVLPLLGEMGSKRATWAAHDAAAVRMNSEFWRAGGTGIELAPCGFRGCGVISHTVLCSRSVLHYSVASQAHCPVQSRFVSLDCCHYCCHVVNVA